MKSKKQELKKIKEEVLNLKSSTLYGYRKENNYFPVIGEGDHNCKVMIIGEAPGENEAKSGRPFCGRAGQILDEVLSEAGMEREKTYITNIVKDRPPENRDPTPEEIEVYAPFLDRQIKVISPAVLVPLGRFSANYLLRKYGFGEKFSISKINGKIFKKGEGLKIVPLFHPAATIYSPPRKVELVEGFKKVKKIT